MILATKSRQKIDGHNQGARLWAISCDMCERVEFWAAPSFHVVGFFLQEAGWFNKGGAVVCRECVASVSAERTEGQA